MQRGLACSKIVSDLRYPIRAWNAVISESGQQVLGNLGHLERKLCWGDKGSFYYSPGTMLEN